MDITKFNNPEILEFYNHQFDFDNQIRENYDDWFKAFKEAVDKRCSDKCFTGLSSGYDSGAMTHLIQDLGVDFKTYTLLYGEKLDVVFGRINRLKNCALYKMPKDDNIRMKTFIEAHIKDEKYTIKYDGKIREQSIATDLATIAGAQMMIQATADNRHLYISTQGADEILSDYKLKPSQSELKGIYPDDLFEWYNFKQGANYSYLLKEEALAKLFGVKVSYPFLDIKLVQEFLWLTPKLKNRKYKAPLYEYLKRNKIPFEKDVKHGLVVEL